jgi:hypothetical protein
MRPACLQKYGFGSSTSAFAVSTSWQVGGVGQETRRLLAKHFDVT